MLVQVVLLGLGAAALLLRRQQEEDDPADQPGPAPPKESFSGRRFLKNLKDATLGDSRQRQQASLSSDQSRQLEAFKEQTGRQMAIAAVATSLALLAEINSVFWLPGAAAVLYLSKDLIVETGRDIKRGRFPGMYLLGLGMQGWMLAEGKLLHSAISGLIGNFLLRIVKRTEDQAVSQLTAAYAWHPGEVWIEREGVELQVPFASLVRGEVVVVRGGEVIPVDGEVVKGHGAVDQHALTGESQPVERGQGERVFASTMLLSGRLWVRVDTSADDTLAAKVANALGDTQSYKDTLVLRGRDFSERLLPAQLTLSAGAFALRGSGAGLAAMWSGLGYNMAVLGPLTVLNYLHILSERGILVKDGRVFELLGRVDTVVFDKTGTLTLDEPEVEAVHPVEGFAAHDLLRLVAAAEQRQTHPIARAILAEAARQGLDLPAADEAACELGFGIQAEVEGRKVQIGSARFLAQLGLEPPPMLEAVRGEAAGVGHSLVYAAVDGAAAGAVELRPTLRPEAAAVVAELKRRGLQLCIISGDHEGPTRHLAETLGIDRYFAEVLPTGKAALVEQLAAEGRFVCFVGDGINDAVALKAAPVSASLKGATTIATDAAQIVFMDGALGRLPELFSFAEEYGHNIKTNEVCTVAPGLLNLTGVFLFGTGVGMAMSINYLSSIANLAIALLPLARHPGQEEQPEAAD